MAEDHPDELLTLGQAASRIGRHPEALRGLIRRHRLQARRDNLGRLLIRLADLSELEHGRPAQPLPAGQAPAAQPDPAETAELREALVEERVARARLEERLVAGELREVELRGRVERAEAAQVKAEARADRLEAALAEARQPWLAKVLEGLRRKG